jgi:hypothetical protein
MRNNTIYTTKSNSPSPTSPLSSSSSHDKSSLLDYECIKLLPIAPLRSDRERRYYCICPHTCCKGEVVRKGKNVQRNEIIRDVLHVSDHLRAEHRQCDNECIMNGIVIKKEIEEEIRRVYGKKKTSKKLLRQKFI